MMATGSRALRSEGAANVAMCDATRATIGRHFHKPAPIRGARVHRSRAGSPGLLARALLFVAVLCGL
jgi:hypothetical protein